MSSDTSAGPTDDRELRLARRAGVVLALLTPPSLAVAGLLNGVAGVAGAATGLALVAILFVVAGVAQGLAARRSRSTMLAVMAGGFVVRLAAYLAVLLVVGQVSSVHRPTLAIASAAGFAVTLICEMHLVSRTPEMFWVDAGKDRGANPRPAQATR